MEGAMVRLTVKTGEKCEVIEADDPAITIGRAASNTVHIAEERASREHCRIERAEGGAYKLTDLASRNGTYLNGQLADEQVLRAGDVIRIGDTTITFEPSGAEEAAQEPPEAPAAPRPEAPQAIRLVFVAGNDTGRTEMICGKITAIGRRSRDSDIAITDSGCSNRHAEIRRGPDGFVLVDAGSKNGTFLNGERVTRSPLAPGDQIRIGRTLIQVRPAEADEAAAAAGAEGAAEASELDLETDRISTRELPEEEPPVAARRWPRVVLPTAVVLAVVVVAGLYFRREIGSWVSPSRRGAAPDLPGTATAVETPDSQQAGQPDAKGRKEPQPSSGTPAVVGATAAEARRIAAELGDAEKLAREKRYGEAIRRFEQIARRYARHQTQAELARRRAAELEREAKAQADAAVRLLQRAELTEEPQDFVTARAALEPLAAALKETRHEPAVAKALTRCQTEPEAAARRQREVEAAALLRGARDHYNRKEPNIARLHCRELLIRFPKSAAAADAETLLKRLNRPGPAP